MQPVSYKVVDMASEISLLFLEWQKKAEGRRRLAHYIIGGIWASIKDGAESAFPHIFRYYKEKCR